MRPLQALVDAGHEVALVVTQPDKRRGRGGDLSPSPVKAAAVDLGLRVTDRVDDVLGVDADLGVVVAFGRLIKPHVLEHVDMVNLHFSLLPRWRGAAPVERAVQAGDAETGVCLMQLEEGLDTGPVYECRRTAIDPEESAADLRERLVRLGTALLVEQLADGLGTPTQQVGEPTYASKIDAAERQIDWSIDAAAIERLVHVGGAWTTIGGRRLKVLSACSHQMSGAGIAVHAGHGTTLELHTVQPEGKAPMPATAWARGARWSPGDPLGT